MLLLLSSRFILQLLSNQPKHSFIHTIERRRFFIPSGYSVSSDTMGAITTEYVSGFLRQKKFEVKKEFPKQLRPPPLYLEMSPFIL